MNKVIVALIALLTGLNLYPVIPPFVVPAKPVVTTPQIIAPQIIPPKELTEQELIDRRTALRMTGFGVSAATLTNAGVRQYLQSQKINPRFMPKNFPCVVGLVTTNVLCSQEVSKTTYQLDELKRKRIEELQKQLKNRE